MTQKAFDIFIERILSHEGGYVNHPRDPGGETNWGITKATAQANGYTGSMRSMSRNDAIAIYRRAYWENSQASQMPAAIAFQYFDACVNHGIQNASKILQRAAKVADDGIIGKQTLAAIKKANQAELVSRFHAERLAFYTHIATFSTFGKGWVRRATQNIQHGVDDLNTQWTADSLA
ncbi:glycoside hydrolase family 108 protein [Kingella kingae]|uniref:glycoside hydrolase family 108 protein n=1 Tax=Kingella kingae TaxID=504 RepID=UPI00254BC78C|nr:glycoside hydrolase family 108 protein [Kingella kingae]MDK4564972.1 glycoside hydrolase family 108 protein [Kingella kingae]MDK4578437.1 glycoside hydrolase family 108 protein [Kingella kingae]MDK4608568.1 glycoside hydrolase family 108 protein [Kingella kingae]MDK4626466.1 glycoside hydrolase family 108 protein [Kingella kingae]MDK4674292.1 glycoside hydrolase family 108 protein [Kingella kingae]